ncbi:hypothetical protein UFOVP1290_377 [uncultured Caudovirales phage]|uniref:Uncharacterized protein n=1 Tax=uncultured Caudovirales phage TaxID=2100421 RepID=A0A6J5RRE7_9CAUD|nr:hypothetical protein UFOVP1290_377 [uncultured Caudovirales phage]
MIDFDCHPEILKFWQNAGFEISKISKVDPLNPFWTNLPYYLNKNNNHVIACRSIDDSPVYLFNNIWRDEKDMLRIIKIAAFT